MKKTWHFYPSHLTKGLIASVMSLSFATYALKEFAQIGKDDPPMDKLLMP